MCVFFFGGGVGGGGFSTGLVQLLHRWSSTPILSDYWGTFWAGGHSNVCFSLVPAPGLEPGQAQS